MYSWVVNEAKFHRAEGELKKLGKEVTEEALKEVYVRLAGLVREIPSERSEFSAPIEVKKKLKKDYN